MQILWSPKENQMNLRDLDTFYAERIRALQNSYPEAHDILVTWGKWSRDRHKVYPAGVSPKPMWEQAIQSNFDDLGEDHDIPAERLAQADAKSEAPEREDYDEKTGREIDERIHAPGGLGTSVRLAIKVAYVSRYLPEDQFPRAAGCSEDAFRERLEEALRFVGRFV
jgi:hypothetical protein